MNLNDSIDTVTAITQVNKYEPFFGKIYEQMPLLIASGRVPANMWHALYKRIYSKDSAVSKEWNFNYYHTGDVSIAGSNKDHIINLDSKLVYAIDPKNFFDGASALPDGAWNELRAQKQGVLYLSAKEAEQVDGKGFVKKNGVWQPANKSVGKFWDALSRGRSKELTGYAQKASEASGNSQSVLNIYLNKTLKDGKPTWRLWCLRWFHLISDAYGIDYLNYIGHLVGVVPEAQGAETQENQGFSGPQNSQRVLRESGVIVPSLEQMLAIVNNPDLNRQGMVEAITTHYQK